VSICVRTPVDIFRGTRHQLKHRIAAAKVGFLKCILVYVTLDGHICNLFKLKKVTKFTLASSLSPQDSLDRVQRYMFGCFLVVGLEKLWVFVLCQFFERLLNVFVAIESPFVLPVANLFHRGP